MRTSQTSRILRQGHYAIQLIDTSVFSQIKTLTGKTVHIVGPRKLENELLVNFVKKETGADCFVTDFADIENHLDDHGEEPTRLFLIDYREPRLQEMLKLATLNGNGASLARCLVSMFNSSKEKDAAERKHRRSTCGVLFNCDATSVLLNWMYRLFSGAGSPKNFSTASSDTAGETATSCPLTWRELQLLMLMTEGLKNREIAGRIGISSHTVRTHLHNSFGKLGVRNRLEASGWMDAHISYVFLLI